MKLDSVRSLKKELLQEDLFPKIDRAELATSTRSRRDRQHKPQIPLAMGICGGKNKYRLAVRVQDITAGLQTVLNTIRHRAKGEVDVRMVGKVVKQQVWHRRRNRPLRIGSSISHFSVTAGTLGCFVANADDSKEELILSNNHVMADENRGRAGDPILQPGSVDGGRTSRDTVATLRRYIRLRKKGNSVDAATASLKDGTEYYYNDLQGLGEITGLRDEYDMGVLSFDGQIEIEPAGSRQFSLGGDSGSLIVDEGMNAIGLLFAGNGVDATYANPITNVLESLGVQLVY